MAMWGRMPLPPIPICPQEPWEAQEEAHRDRSRVKFSFRVPPGVETRLRDAGPRSKPTPRTPCVHMVAPVRHSHGLEYEYL